MADELVFPASNTLSLIDELTSGMMNEEILVHDINPSFPQSEASIDIPEIIPPIICHKDNNATFNPVPGEPFRPLTELMEEPGDIPLTSNITTNISEPIMDFNNIKNTPGIAQEPLLRHHIQSPLGSNSVNFVNPNPHATPMQTVQNTHCLVIGGQRVPISTPTQPTPSVIHTKHSSNPPLLQTTHALHSNSNVNVDNKLKQTMLVKASLNEHMNIPTKPPMKGQIIKTPDQRLMFVTEVNGRRVGYLIQQPKQNNVQNNIPSQNNVPNAHFSRVQSFVSSGHLENKKNLDGTILSSSTSETPNIDNQIKSSSPINFTLDENKEIIMRHSDSVAKATEPLLKTDMKSLREKLLNLRNPLNSKNQPNSKVSLTFPSMPKPAEPAEKSPEEYALCTENTPGLASPSIPASSSVENVEDPTSNEIAPHNDHNNDTHSLEMPDEEEEEGQEIEFSENDLTADVDGTDQSCSPDYENDANHEEEIETEIRSRVASTDDEDSVPLSKLRIDTNDNCLSPKEGGQEGSPTGKTKKGRTSKKGQSAKKEGKVKVKKKKDSRKPKKPIIPYQFYFRDIQKDVRAENPQMHFGEISKLVSKKWEALDESDKKKYIDAHEEDKLEYAEKIKVYKELIAQEEAACPTESIASPVQKDSNKVESDAQTKKKGKRGKKRKLVEKPSAEVDNNLGENEIPLEGEQLDAKDKEQHEQGLVDGTNGKQEIDDNPPSSPSLPSSSSSSEDEEDSETAITRIREKAAELHKYLKQQRAVVTKKPKQSDKKIRATKIEVKELPAASNLKDDEDNEVKAEVVLEATDTAEMEEADNQKKEELKDEVESHNDEMPADADEFTDKARELMINDTKTDESDLIETEDPADDASDTVSKDASFDSIGEDIEDMEVEGPNGVKNTNSKEDSENDEISDDEVVGSVRRKKSRRIKKMEENSPKSEKSRKGREAKKVNSNDNDLSDDEANSNFGRKKSLRIKKMEEKEEREEKSRKAKDKKAGDEKSTSDEEPTRSRRSKKKKINYTDKSDSEEEDSNSSKENIDDSNSNHTDSNITDSNNTDSNNTTDGMCQDEKGKLEDDNSEKLSIAKELLPPVQEKESSTVELKDREIKTLNNDSSKNIEMKPLVEQSSIKNTFRIPKKSGASDGGLLVLRGPRICIRHSCEKPAVTSRERGGQYCGNECLVLYCREVFEAWVIDREKEESKT